MLFFGNSSLQLQNWFYENSNQTVATCIVNIKLAKNWLVLNNFPMIYGELFGIIAGGHEYSNSG